jgi:hypothetical protein
MSNNAETKKCSITSTSRTFVTLRNDEEMRRRGRMREREMYNKKHSLFCSEISRMLENRERSCVTLKLHLNVEEKRLTSFSPSKFGFLFCFMSNNAETKKCSITSTSRTFVTLRNDEEMRRRGRMSKRGRCITRNIHCSVLK